MNISVIITTYNRPIALSIVLRSLFKQSRLPDEIIIADDGSKEETNKLLEAMKIESPCTLKHVWQTDEGFRAAKVRNKASLQATGDYLVFLDGDSVVFPDFISKHENLAETGWFVAGNRILLNESLTHNWEDEKCNPLNFSLTTWIKKRFMGEINRILPLIHLPIKGQWRKKKSKQWEGAKTCNLAIWHKDFIAVNGFDEIFQGWGHEDADLVVRLLNSGIFRKEGRFSVPILHLWHPESSRTTEIRNLHYLQQRIVDKLFTQAIKGITHDES